jgi:hypothetical protein
MTYPPSGYGNFGPPGPPAGPPAGPPMPPEYGYLVPAMPAYAAPDRLVTPVHEGFGGWFSRVFATLGRSWLSLVLISWLTYGLPLAVLVPVFRYQLDRMLVAAPSATGQVSVDDSRVGTLVVIILVAFIVIGFANGVAHAAVVWAVTREAAGQPRSLGGALGYGLRNGLRMFGWGLLYGLLVGVGLCACVAPGLYFALAGCLYVPVALYRRGMHPIGTSFSLVNRNFGAALGRMALLIVMLYGVQLVLAVPVQAVTLQASQGVALAVSIVLQFVTAPLTLVTTVGSTLLFAELWNRQSPITIAHLDGALAPAA